MLQIKNLTKIYANGKVGADDININVVAGDIYGFIGPNGAGKTTTLNCCCGILNFDKGDVLVDSISIKSNNLEFKKQIAYLPDNPVLYEFMTGTEYINFIADIFNVSDSERKQKADKYAELFFIKDAMNKPITSYSHGMKQKLAIISSLVHSPKLLLLDEPFVGLDPKAIFNFKSVLQEFCKNGGAVFFSTHVLEVAQSLCNKIAIIINGKIIRQGNTKEVVKDSSLEKVFLELVDEK